MSATDAYRLLDIPPTASPEAIRTAFRQKAHALHPDVNPAPNAAEAFRELKAAHDLLLDPIKRLQHDKRLGYSTPTPSKHTNTKQKISEAQRQKAASIVDGWKKDSSHVLSAWENRQMQERRRLQRVRWILFATILSLVALLLWWFAAYV